MAAGFRLNIPNAPRIGMPPRGPSTSQILKQSAPKLTLPKNNMSKVSRPFQPRQRRFNPAPNPKQF